MFCPINLTVNPLRVRFFASRNLYCGQRCNVLFLRKALAVVSSPPAPQRSKSRRRPVTLVVAEGVAAFFPTLCRSNSWQEFALRNQGFGLHFLNQRRCDSREKN